MVDLEAGKTGIRGLPREQLPSVRQVLREGWFFCVPVIVMLLCMIAFNYEAQTAGVYAIVAMILVSFLGKRENWMTPKRIWRALGQGGFGSLGVGCALAVAGTLTMSFALTGIGLRITDILIQIAGGSKLLILVGTTFIVIILGMAVGPTPVYLTVAFISVPAMLQTGIPPMAAHMFLLFLCSAALITPPVCMSSFVAAQLAGANYMRTGYTGMRLGIVAFLVPFIFVYSPELLLIGSPIGVIWATITATIGVLVMSPGLAGYLLSDLGPVNRVLLVLAGVAMIIPGWKTDILGAAVASAILLWQRRARVRAKAKPSLPVETSF
jgi:TRAP-type uncharacterized transport system fused permease subunit